MVFLIEHIALGERCISVGVDLHGALELGSLIAAVCWSVKILGSWTSSLSFLELVFCQIGEMESCGILKDFFFFYNCECVCVYLFICLCPCECLRPEEDVGYFLASIFV